MFKWINMSDETIGKLSHREGYEPKKSCNGCGSGWNAKVVPDTIYFLNITPICCRHDDRYEHGVTEEDKVLSDEEFLDNLLLAVESVDKWWYPTKLARHRAMTYYSMVVDHGDDAFYDK